MATLFVLETRFRRFEYSRMLGMTGVKEVLESFQRDPASISGKDLRNILKEELPRHMLRIYGISADWKVRTEALRIARGYCRRSEAAVELGKSALFDRSKHVRFAACALLACSLRTDAIPVLEKAQQRFLDSLTQNGTKAAVDAIQHQNHAFFWDIDHSGKVIVNFEAPILQ